MRADRLLAILLLLQNRGRMSADQLSKELEVSERTIYRDMSALSTAGIPVYSETGCQGGFSLVEDYRTRLTGLTTAEARTLFMLSIPAPLAELGIIRELKSALLKLSTSLPQSQRDDEDLVRQRIYLDTSQWHTRQAHLPHLQIIYEALWKDARLVVREQTWYGGIMNWPVDPLGLVAKAGTWYLVAVRSGRVHVWLVSKLMDVTLQDTTFKRPVEFDLVEFWDKWCKSYQDQLNSFTADLRVSPDIIPWLPSYFGDEVIEIIEKASPPDAMGWLRIELAFESLESARAKILGLGSAVEVLEPLALRLSVQDYAEQILKRYTALST